MAQVDVQWPSEDEDFDATIDKAIKSRTENSETKSTPTAVAVQEHPDDKQPEPPETPRATPEMIEPLGQPKEPAAEQPMKPAEVAPVIPSAATPVANNSSQSKGRNTGRTILEAVLVLAVLGLGAWAYMLYTDRNDAQAQVSSLQAEVKKLNDNPQIAVQKQTDDLLKKVGALMDLPDGETPTVANVSDAAAAKKESAFFNNAQNGDRVLMYVKAGQAILYRPSTNKIILVAPLTFTGNNAPAATTSKTSTTAR